MVPALRDSQWSSEPRLEDRYVNRSFKQCGVLYLKSNMLLWEHGRE